MKVVEATDDRLTIEDRPWFLWLFLPPMGLGAVATALAGRYSSYGETALVLTLGLGVLWVAWYYAPFQRFVFDRASGRFTHRVGRLTGSLNFERDLSSIERAVSGPYWVDGSRLERVVLKVSDGHYPLESGFTGLSRAKVTEAINDWLDADRDTPTA
ncbi:MAG: hypothetical protein AAGK37_10975 [Pseudomonadota bacterium]